MPSAQHPDSPGEYPRPSAQHPDSPGQYPRAAAHHPQPSGQYPRPSIYQQSPTQYRGHDACHRLSPGQHPRPTIRHLQPPVPPPRRSPSFPKSPLQQPKPPANYSHPSDQHKISDLPQPTKCPGSQVKSSKLHVTSPGQSRRPPLNYSQSRGQYQKRRVNCLDLPGDHQRLFEQLPNQPVHPGKQRSELTIGLLREQCWQVRGRGAGSRAALGSRVLGGGVSGKSQGPGRHGQYTR